MSIADLLSERQLPDLMKLNNNTLVNDLNGWAVRREEIKDILQREIYGIIPERSSKIHVLTYKESKVNWAGKAKQIEYIIGIDTPKGIFSFPVILVLPVSEIKRPLILSISYESVVPYKYLPVEEMLDEGFAVASFCYNDISFDGDDGFTGQMAPYFINKNRKPDDFGKIGMWAYAVSLILDFIEQKDFCDIENTAVAGHSRLGKTALLAAALDERITFTLSNNSGCGGDAITRGKRGEHVADICKTFPFWFCENYQKYSDNEENLPFDQHFLLSLIAPRYIAVGAAEEDIWCDPYSQYLTCAAVSDVYSLYGKKGFVFPDRLPEVNECFHEGSVGFHYRKGMHFFSREDWAYYFSFIKKKL